MKYIYVCSPLRGDIENNKAKAIQYCKEIIAMGNMPLAPHIYFTQFLDDTKEEERKTGISYGMEWLKISDEIRVYGDYTKSEGMTAEINWWKENKKTEIKYFKSI